MPQVDNQTAILILCSSESKRSTFPPLHPSSHPAPAFSSSIESAHLEGILLSKIQNHVPPLPSGIGSIKHLGRKHTK